jgi:hypothetical protein
MKRSVILVVFAVCGVATALALGPIRAGTSLRTQAVQVTPAAVAPAIQKCICGDRSTGGESCICRDLCPRGDKCSSTCAAKSTGPCAEKCAGKCGDKCQGQCGDKCKNAGADKCPGRGNCAGQKSCGKRAA